MTAFDLIVAGGLVVLPDRQPAHADVAIAGGRIARILAPGAQVDTHERIDAGGLVVFPGLIDAHLHLGHGRDISRPRVPDDAARETAAAAVGGITTCIPYLMSSAPHEDSFDEVCRVTEAGARIDFGYT